MTNKEEEEEIVQEIHEQMTSRSNLQIILGWTLMLLIACFSMPLMSLGYIPFWASIAYMFIILIIELLVTIRKDHK